MIIRDSRWSYSAAAARQAADNPGETSVKFVPRAAVAALITITAAATAVLPFPVPALASPVPPYPNPGLIGTWANTNPATRSIVDIVISRSGKGIVVNAFGKCEPTACQGGDIPATLFGSQPGSVTGNSFEAGSMSGHHYKILLGTLGSSGKVRTLTVQEFTIFTGDTSRVNNTKTETFRPGKPIKPTQSGTPATRYPLGHSVPPVPALLGTWTNISPDSGGIAKIVLTRSGRTLVVSAFGKCHPTLCVWGKIDGITFGTAGIHSVSGRVFLAPYVFSFAEDLLDGTVNAAGTLLTVAAYTQFTDHSGRSNYLATDTFRRA